jgi:hypothetical protein
MRFVSNHSTVEKGSCSIIKYGLIYYFGGINVSYYSWVHPFTIKNTPGYGELTNVYHTRVEIGYDQF